MFHCIIVDDLSSCVADIKQLLEENHPEFRVVGVFSDYETARREVSTMGADLIFMDVELGSQSGFDLVRELALPDSTQVIFVTAHEKYTLQALRLNALDFLVKPVNADELASSLSRFKEQHEVEASSRFPNRVKEELMGEVKRLIEEAQKPQRLVLNQLGKVVLIPFTEINYIFSDGSYSEIFTRKREKHVASFAIGEFEDMLPAEHFFRIHRSMIVNLDAISEVSTGSKPEVLLADKTVLPVARRRISRLVSALNK